MEKVGPAVWREVLQAVAAKEGWAGSSKWLQRLNFSVAIIAVIYLTITNSIVSASNIIFANIMLFDAYLHASGPLSAAFVWLFLALTLKVALLGLLILVTRLMHKESNDRWSKFRLSIRKYLVCWLVVYETILVPISVLSFRYAGKKMQFVFFVSFFLAGVIINVFWIKLLYRNTYFIVIAVLCLTATQTAPLCLCVINSLIVLRGPLNQRPYVMLAIAYDLIIYANAVLASDISSLHLAVVTVAVLAIALSLPAASHPAGAGEALLESIAKLHEGETLSRTEEWSIYRLACHVQSEAKRHSLPLEGEQGKAIESLQKLITKQGLCGLLKLWISLQKASVPPSLMFDIQLSEGELYCSQFGMGMVARLEGVSRAVEERGKLEERLRMMKLRRRLEGELLARDEKLRITPAIIGVEKCRETFRLKLEGLLELYIIFWRSPPATEHQIMKKLTQICQAEGECKDLLAVLRENRQMRSETHLFNYIQSNFNNSSLDAFPADPRTEPVEDLAETMYILVDSNIIVDASEQVAKQMQMQKSFLVGSDLFSIIPAELQQYYRDHVNEWLATNCPVDLPLASSQDANVLFPAQCHFRILPEIERGVRYFINVRSNFGRQREILLFYSLRQDRIVKISEAFEDQDSTNFAGEDLLGIDLTFLSKYHRPQQGNEEIICEVSLKRKRRKSISNKPSKQIQHFLRLLNVYETKTDQLYLLRIAGRGEEILTETSLTHQLKHTEKSFLELRTNSTTFCPIKNPFEQLLDERLNQHHTHLFKLTYMRKITAILLIAICVGLGAFLQFNGVVETSVSTLSMQVGNLASQLGKYETVYVLFYQYYVYIHTIKRPQDFQLPRAKINLTKLQTQYKSKVPKNIRALLVVAVDPTVAATPNSYQLVYPDYKVNGSVESITLLPLLEGMQSSLVSQNFTFVLQNVRVADLFMDSLLPVDTNILGQVEEQQQYFLVAAIVGMLVAVLLVKAQYMQIRVAVWNIIDLYSKISREEARAQLALLYQFKQAFKEKENNDCEKHPNNKRQRNLQGSQQDRSQFIKPIKKNKFLSVLMKENLILLVIVLAWAILYFYCHSRLDTYKAEIKMITDYSAQLQLISKINVADSELYYRAALQELLPANQRTQWQYPPVTQLPSFLPIAATLPSSFKDFESNQGSYLRQNICSQPSVMSGYQGDLFMSTMNCSSVLKGVLAEGFDSAFPYYIHILRANIGTMLSNLSLTRGQNSVYPFFAEAIFCRKAFDVVINNLSKAFNVEVGEFLDIKQVEFSQLAGLAMLTLVLVSVLTGVYVWKMRRLCRAARKSFTLLPKRLIYNIRISKSLVQGSILNDVQQLTL